MIKSDAPFAVDASATADDPPMRACRMIDPDMALRLVLQAAGGHSVQKVPLVDICGLQLAEEIRSEHDYPAFPRAMMDGYAVRTSDAGQTVEVVGEVAAGSNVETRVVDGQCLEIMTGAPCPPGTQAVVQKEHVRRDGNRVALPNKILSGGHIAPQGSECQAGTVVLVPGDTITPLATAVLASLGLTTVLATARPSLAVITTGSELVPPGRRLGPGQIRDSNGPMLIALARDMGIQAPLHLHVADDSAEILNALGEVADRDIVLLTGGVSVGNYDLVPGTLEDFDARLIFHKVTQKPGKPLLLAKKGEQVIFGLPGNPLACHFCFHRYVAAAVRVKENKTPTPPELSGTLAEPVHPKAGRTFYIPARACEGKQANSRWRLEPLPGVSSADVFAPCRANCYLEVPPGKSPLAAGEDLRFTWIGNAPWPN